MSACGTCLTRALNTETQKQVQLIRVDVAVLVRQLDVEGLLQGHPQMGIAFEVWSHAMQPENMVDKKAGKAKAQKQSSGKKEKAQKNKGRRKKARKMKIEFANEPRKEERKKRSKNKEQKARARKNTIDLINHDPKVHSYDNAILVEVHRLHNVKGICPQLGQCCLRLKSVQIHGSRSWRKSCKTLTQRSIRLTLRSGVVSAAPASLVTLPASTPSCSAMTSATSRSSTQPTYRLCAHCSKLSVIRWATNHDEHFGNSISDPHTVSDSALL